MDLKGKYIEELIDLRKNERQAKNWLICDEIRNYLDSKFVFIFDTKDGQEVYHELKGMTRVDLIDRINKNIRLEKVFNAWLYTMTLKTNN